MTGSAAKHGLADELTDQVVEHLGMIARSTNLTRPVGPVNMTIEFEQEG